MTFEQAVEQMALTCPFTNEPVDAKTLAGILKNDVVLAVIRPGSYQGINMRDVLRSHGFIKDDRN